MLIADREFIGAAWFAFPRQQRIKRCIRIREDTLLDDLPVRDGFQNLAPGEVRGLFEKAEVFGEWMQAAKRPHGRCSGQEVVATRSSTGERVVIATDLKIPDACSTYKKRWSIESTFSANKRRGFQLEATQMTQPDRIQRLFGLLALATFWAIKTGRWVADRVRVPMKKGCPAWSLFLLGWMKLASSLQEGGTRLLTLLSDLCPLSQTAFPPG